MAEALAPRLGKPTRRREAEMTMQLVKIEGTWTVIGKREDGTSFNYRFGSKREAEKWMKQF